MSRYYFGQDGEDISEEINRVFDLSYINARKNKEEKFDFVGVLIQEDKQLIVFPKHMYTKEELLEFQINNHKGIQNFRLVMEVVQKFIKTKNTRASAEDYLGNLNDLIESTFPFDSFFEIYEYFQRYGIFSEKKIEITNSGNGKYHWKTIIERSQPYITSTGIVFTPLFREKICEDYSFISEAMAFVINETIENFYYLFPSRKAEGIFYNSLCN